MNQRAAAPTREPDELQEVTPTIVSLEAQTRGEVDIQIVTAKRFPRSVTAFIQQAETLATLNADVAASCFYALPRGGKSIEGPSARLAEICASCWGHMRIQARIVDEDERFVTARGESWDMQNNVAIGYEVRRRITDKSGRKYQDDMVGVTSNAAASIALRNAVFKVIPSAFWRPIYEKCRKVAIGDAKTLVNRRADQLLYFQKMGVDEARVLVVLGVKGVEDITLDHMGTLRGLATAIKEGDTTVDEAFPATPVKMPERKTEQGTASVDAPTTTPHTGEEPPPGAAPAGADWLTEVNKHGPARNGHHWWVVKTGRGVEAYTWSTTIGAQLEAVQAEGAFVDLDTEKDKNQANKIVAVARFDALGGAGREPGAEG